MVIQRQTVSSENTQVTVYRLSRLYSGLYVYANMHVITISQNRGHEFEGEEGMIYKTVWWKEKEGKM